MVYINDMQAASDHSHNILATALVVPPLDVMILYCTFAFSWRHWSHCARSKFASVYRGCVISHCRSICVKTPEGWWRESDGFYTSSFNSLNMTSEKVNLEQIMLLVRSKAARIGRL